MEIHFVTGANGFLGSYLVKALIDSGKKVRAIKRANSDVSLLGSYIEKIDWYEGDILDMVSLEEALENVSYVYHSAALITFIPSEVPAMMEINIKGTANMVNAALMAGVKKFLYVSSISAFGRSNTGKVIDEDFGWLDDGENSWYSRSKQHGEREVWRAQHEGLNTVIVCPGTILGGGNWNYPPLNIFKTIHNKLPFYTEGLNGFVDVRDCVNIILKVMQGPFQNEKFIMVSENIEFRTLMNAIADELEVPHPKYKLNTFFATLAIWGDRLRTLLYGGRPLLTKETVRMSNLKFQYSNEKVKNKLGYTFIPIDRTIHDTAVCFKESVKTGKNFCTF